MKAPRPVRALLAKIAAGESHRCANDTYQTAVDMGLAFYDLARDSSRRWTLTDKGRIAIGLPLACMCGETATHIADDGLVRCVGCGCH
jgi:hypothetical protein